VASDKLQVSVVEMRVIHNPQTGHSVDGGGEETQCVCVREFLIRIGVLRIQYLHYLSLILWLPQPL